MRAVVQPCLQQFDRALLSLCHFALTNLDLSSFYFFLLPLLSFIFLRLLESFLFFFFNDTATTEIYTLSLHDALPICERYRLPAEHHAAADGGLYGQLVFARAPVLVVSAAAALAALSVDVMAARVAGGECEDRKSTRLNSSH